MINLPTGSRIWLVAGVTDMRKSFQGLSAQVESRLKEASLSGQLFVFRGRRGDLLKIYCAYCPNDWSGDFSSGQWPEKGKYF